MALAILLSLPVSASSQTVLTPRVLDCTDKDLESARKNTGVDAIDALLSALRKESFPELAHVDLGVRTFHSESDFFRTRFSLSRFVLLRPMRFYVAVNPDLFQRQAPSDGVCAILAHELSHVVSLSHNNRMHRFGLIRLLSKRYAAMFERRTDLEAIHRGYGDGLKSYRAWVYANIPLDRVPQKRRDYFAPGEIAAIQTKLQDNPDLFAYWAKHVPENVKQIENSPGRPASDR